MQKTAASMHFSREHDLRKRYYRAMANTQFQHHRQTSQTTHMRSAWLSCAWTFSLSSSRACRVFSASICSWRVCSTLATCSTIDSRSCIDASSLSCLDSEWYSLHTVILDHYLQLHWHVCMQAQGRRNLLKASSARQQWQHACLHTDSRPQKCRRFRPRIILTIWLS